MPSKGHRFCIDTGLDTVCPVCFSGGQTNSTRSFIRRTTLNDSQSPTAKENPPNYPKPTLCSAEAKAIILALWKSAFAQYRQMNGTVIMHTVQLLYTLYPLQHGMMDPYRPVASPILFQKLKDGLSIHVWRSVQPSDVEDCRS